MLIINQFLSGAGGRKVKKKKKKERKKKKIERCIQKENVGTKQVINTRE